MSMQPIRRNDDGQLVFVATDEPVPLGPDFTEVEEKTKQGFLEDTDINRMLTKAAITGSLSHLEQYQGLYADLSDFDYEEAQNHIALANEIFDSLPDRHKREFRYNPKEFLEFVNDPQNAARLDEIFPDLAQPGIQLPRPGPPPGPTDPASPRTPSVVDAPNSPQNSPEEKGGTSGGEDST